MITSITATVFTSIFLLEAIDASTWKLHLSKSFVGLVTMPLILASVDEIMAALRSCRDGIAGINEVGFGSSN